MKTKLIRTVLFVGLIIFSCKKEDKEPPPINNNGNNTTAGGPAVSNATVFSSIFSSGSQTIVGLFTSTNASVYFSSSPQPSLNSTTAIMVDTVKLNGVNLSYNTSQSQYNYPLTPDLSSELWFVKGANGIPSFTFANTNLKPNASNQNSIPAIINKSASFTVNINSVANVSSALFILDDGNGGSITRTLSIGNNTVVVNTNDLLSLTTGDSDAAAMVILENSKAYSISGKVHKFTKYSHFLKFIDINP